METATLKDYALAVAAIVSALAAVTAAWRGPSVQAKIAQAQRASETRVGWLLALQTALSSHFAALNNVWYRDKDVPIVELVRYHTAAGGGTLPVPAFAQEAVTRVIASIEEAVATGVAVRVLLDDTQDSHRQLMIEMNNVIVFLREHVGTSDNWGAVMSPLESRAWAVLREARQAIVAGI
jgi:hypothetical protein